MFHKFTCLLFIMFALTGCVIKPYYYDHREYINISKMKRKIPNANFETDTELYEDDGNYYLKLDRYSWFDKNLTIKKEGFEDYHIKLDNVWTNEPWAFEGDFILQNKERSIISFLNPLYIFDIPFGLVIAAAEADTSHPDYGKSCTVIFAFPINITNFFGTIILNPWTKYEIQTGDLILTPTEELQQSCHLKKNYFISNYGCLPCNSDVKNPISSEEECLRCSNRKWTNTECQIK